MKLKTSWHFTKWYGLNLVLVIQYIPCFNNFAAMQIFFDIFLLKWRIKLRKFWTQRILSHSRIFFIFGSRLNFYFFEMFIFTTLWKSTLKMATLFRRCLTLFKSTLKWFNVVNFNVHVHNVVWTLIWRLATLQCHINLKTTLKRRWNVFWAAKKMKSSL